MCKSESFIRWLIRKNICVLKCVQGVSLKAHRAVWGTKLLPCRCSCICPSSSASSATCWFSPPLCVFAVGIKTDVWNLLVRRTHWRHPAATGQDCKQSKNKRGEMGFQGDKITRLLLNRVVGWKFVLTGERRRKQRKGQTHWQTHQTHQQLHKQELTLETRLCFCLSASLKSLQELILWLRVCRDALITTLSVWSADRCSHESLWRHNFPFLFKLAKNVSASCCVYGATRLGTSWSTPASSRPFHTPHARPAFHIFRVSSPADWWVDTVALCLRLTAPLPAVGRRSKYYSQSSLRGEKKPLTRSPSAALVFYNLSFSLLCLGSGLPGSSCSLLNKAEAVHHFVQVEVCVLPRLHGGLFSLQATEKDKRADSSAWQTFHKLSKKVLKSASEARATFTHLTRLVAFLTF